MATKQMRFDELTYEEIEKLVEKHKEFGTPRKFIELGAIKLMKKIQEQKKK